MSVAPAERYKGRLIEFRFARVNGRLVCCGLQIGPSLVPSTEPNQLAFDYPFGTGIDSELVTTTEERERERENDLLPLRSEELRFPLADLVDQVLEVTIEFLELGRGHSEQSERFAAERLPAAEAGRTKKRGRKPTYDDAHYQRVAEVYEERFQSGHRDPLRAVMRWADKELDRTIEKSTAASWVREARSTTGATVPSAWLVSRETKRRGRVYRVHYRLGGAGAQTLYAGTFARKQDAETRKRWVLGELAALRVPDLQTAEESTAPTLRWAAARWQASRVDVSTGTGQTYRVALDRLLPRSATCPSTRSSRRRLPPSWPTSTRPG